MSWWELALAIFAAYVAFDLWDILGEWLAYKIDPRIRRMLGKSPVRSFKDEEK